MTNKRLGGRPTKYKEEYCQAVIDVMSEGASKIEFCASIGISNQTFYNWCAERPEFLDAVKIAELHSQAWWEKKGRLATFNSEGFNATAFIFNMKNRFKDDWRDKQEVATHHSGETKTTVVHATQEDLAEARRQMLSEDDC